VTGAQARETSGLTGHCSGGTVPEGAFPTAVLAADVPFRRAGTIYPDPLAARVACRAKRVLGDLFGLTNFGVNLTALAPGAMSALRHAHTKQDEFVYIVQGTPTLRTNNGTTKLSPGMCAGFRAGTGNAHHLVNETGSDVQYLEIGDRTPGDSANWPDDDLVLVQIVCQRRFVHRDGTSY